jgi:RND family efflux transporter MFP subunit
MLAISAAGSALVLAVALPISGCKTQATTAAAAVVPSASVARVQRGSISRTLSLAGQFEPYQVVDVHPKVSGFIRTIYVDIGDRVHKGQTLAILEVPELNAQLQGTVFQVAQSKDEIVRAQHEIASAESQHTALHADYNRLAQASKAQPGLIAQQELDDAQAKDLSSEAQVDAAKAAFSAAQQGAEVAQADNQRVAAIQQYTDVKAPLDGVIIWRYADTGALIQSGTGSDATTQSLPIVKLSQSGLLRLRVPVPEDDVRYVHIGDQMQVRVDALGRSFTGKVVRFTREVSPETRTMETEIDVENKDLTLDPGMYANTELQLQHADGVLTIPVGALVQQGGAQVVYVLDSGNRVRIRPVQVGLEGALLAEIQRGVQQGDRVIASAQDRYRDGEQVSPVLQASPSSDLTHVSGGMIDLHEQAGDEQGGSQ